jgi:hypothetical protein
VARSRPSSNDARGPLYRVIAPNASVRRHDPIQGSTLSESADLATLHSLLLDERRSPSKLEKGEAEPMRLWRVGRWEAWLRRTLAFGADLLLTCGRRSQDRRPFRRQSQLRPLRFCEISLAYLRYLRDLRATCLAMLRVFVSSWLRRARVDGSVISLCLCGSSACQSSTCRGSTLLVAATAAMAAWP